MQDNNQIPSFTQAHWLYTCYITEPLSTVLGNLRADTLPQGPAVMFGCNKCPLVVTNVLRQETELTLNSMIAMDNKELYSKYLEKLFFFLPRLTSNK